MTDYRAARIQGLTPYVAGEQPTDPNIIKLNTNENPYPPSPKALEAIAEARNGLQLYPPTNSDDLLEALSALHNVPTSHLFCGNGSDEVLALAYLAFFGEDKPLCSPQLTYSFYPVYAGLFGVPYESVPMLPDGLGVDIPALLGRGRAMALANPNAPTTIGLSREDIRGIATQLHARGQLLLLDEAYADFAKEDCVPLVEEFPNLLIVRTLSKGYSLAGLRVGYAIGQPHLTQALCMVRDSFNSYPLDRLAQAGAAAAIRDAAYHTRTVEAVVATRERFSQGLRALGFTLPPSSANFVFASHQSIPARDIFTALRKRNILVRYFDKPLLDNHLRITIGTHVEMDNVLFALQDIVEGAV